jgi:hypothetical protein
MFDDKSVFGVGERMRKGGVREKSDDAVGRVYLRFFQFYGGVLHARSAGKNASRAIPHPSRATIVNRRSTVTVINP